jgi:hypothetical protein
LFKLVRNLSVVMQPLSAIAILRQSSQLGSKEHIYDKVFIARIKAKLVELEFDSILSERFI